MIIVRIFVPLIYQTIKDMKNATKSYDPEVLKEKALEAYPQLVTMFKKNRKMNHRMDIAKGVTLVYGVSTKGDIIVHIGSGKVMAFWDFMRAL